MPAGSAAVYTATAATQPAVVVNSYVGAPGFYDATAATGTKVAGPSKTYVATAATTGGVPGASKIFTATAAVNRVTGASATFTALPATSAALAPAYMMVSGVLRPVVEYIYKA